ncbi:MAG: hypothetical protein DYG92_08450 [Leptolyngbya sp. PLA1]|nr:hypothetical protein [Leptolyngbya sp. PLA1]
MMQPPSSPAVRTIAAVATACGLLLGSCTTTGPGASPPRERVHRDTPGSEQLARQALQHLQSDPSRAESLLARALAADLYNGPAHNNLGTLYLRQGKLYEAAEEFEWARKLLPGHPDPRLNLALTLEHAGRTGEALATYATALEVYPEHIPSMQALARLQVRSGHEDKQTPRLLAEIALRGETTAWREWAKEQGARGR